MVLILLILGILAFIFVGARAEPQRPQETDSTYQATPTVDTPDANKPTNTKIPSAKEALAQIREVTEREGDWMEKMRRKYPVRTLPDGTTRVEVRDEWGYVYTCRSSKRPSAEEYWFIIQEIDSKKRRGDYLGKE